MVEITKEYFNNLIEAYNKLEALHQAGVDNWTGYEEAMEILETMR